MNNQQLLIIENCDEVRENLAEMLEFFGYLITTASNGREGVKACIEEPPDLILCDIKMSDLDGYGVLNLLSRDERTRGIPLIFISAKTEPKDIKLGIDLGASGYISKPFSKDEVLSLIHSCLGQLTRDTTQNI
jgi:CheY-like chemotaxis protein